MFDLWGFLLQTLTATGVAVLLLIIKWLFRDKLPPKWHFAVWGVLGMMILVPAGWDGRYTLINWRFPIEILKGLTGDYSFTQVQFPIPIIKEIPDSLTEWLFAIYIVGVIVCLARYMVSYIRLRNALSKGHAAPGEITEQVKVTAQQLNVKPCRVIAVGGLPSAFVSGIFHPVLAVPANKEIDDKIVMHELFHLKSHDTIWSVVICVLRSLHWCNPLIAYCASCASNDMEARCDQYVLEHLEGEERREYGLTLLEMVNERFATTPGTTCVNNGGKRIRERIETIARFKKYPVGMRLVSICAVVVLTLSLIIGVPATKVVKPFSSYNLVSYASARSVFCTTFAGAFDTYAKAVLTNNIYYRTMCAPVEEQAELSASEDDAWSDEIATLPDMQHEYYVYNLQQLEKDAYEGMIVFVLDCSDNELWDEYELYNAAAKDVYETYEVVDAEDLEEEYETLLIAAQNLRVEKQKGRWVVTPAGNFRIIETSDVSLGWGCEDLPGIIYSGEVNDFSVDVKVQSVYMVDNSLQNQDDMDMFLGTNGSYDLTAKPNAVFTSGSITHSSSLKHLGTQEERDQFEDIGLSLAEVYHGEKRPAKVADPEAHGEDWSSSDGQSAANQTVEPGWGPYIDMDAGSGTGFDSPKSFDLPEYYIANLYLDKKFAGQVDLYPEKGAAK